ncbi:MAG: bacteriochlorophyll 4-vinyl reductase [Pseudomonadota bacterium]
MQPSEHVPGGPVDLSADGLALRQVAGVVGPNAVLQLVEPLRFAGGQASLDRVFNQARLSHYLKDPPLAMVPEEEAYRLFTSTRDVLGNTTGDLVLKLAGQGTARYVMQNRIPGTVRGLLKTMPPRFAAPMLLNAIKRNAWTFAGSGVCSSMKSRPGWIIEIASNPLATPSCPWHVAVLETLFQSLVSKVSQIESLSDGLSAGACCRFAVRMG